MSKKWIDNEEIIIFEQGKDPGTGFLRIVGDLEKIQKVEDKHAVSFREVHDVVFGKGTSTFLEQYSKETKKGNTIYIEEQYRIVGLTKECRAILVVLTPRDNGMAKRIISAWQVGRDSDELKKLLNDCPHLKERLIKK